MDEVLYNDPDGEMVRFKVVQDMELARTVLDRLTECERVAFDCEGVDLGRHPGEVSVVSFLEMSEAGTEAFLFDLVEPVYAAEVLPLIRALLESENVEKVTFDVRADSDGLFHNHGVNIRNVLDLQPYKQAIDRQLGNYSVGPRGFRWVQGMTKCCLDLLPADEILFLRNGVAQTPPHKRNGGSGWRHRPLNDSDWRYAACDVFAIHLLFKAMETHEIAPEMMQAVRISSQNYVAHLRDHPRRAEWPRDRFRILRDVPLTEYLV